MMHCAHLTWWPTPQNSVAATNLNINGARFQSAARTRSHIATMVKLAFALLSLVAAAGSVALAGPVDTVKADIVLITNKVWSTPTQLA